MQKPGIKRVCGRMKELQCVWTLEGRMEEVLQDEAVAGGTRLPLALRVCSVMSNSATLWTAACQAPLSVHGNFPGKNTGVGCHFLVQGIFPTQVSSPCLLHWQTDSFTTVPPGSLGYLILNSQLICRKYFYFYHDI